MKKKEEKTKTQKDMTNCNETRDDELHRDKMIQSTMHKATRSNRRLQETSEMQGDKLRHTPRPEIK